MDMSKEVIIRLDFPVQLADKRLTEVTMRRPIMKDMIKHVKNNMGLEEDMGLVADLCNLTISEIEMFDTCDYEKLQSQLLRFRGVKSN